MCVYCVHVVCVCYIAATHNNPDNIESIRQTAKLVAAAASEVGVTYETSRMIDIYSASGTFADW